MRFLTLPLVALPLIPVAFGHGQLGPGSHPSRHLEVERRNGMAMMDEMKRAPPTSSAAAADDDDDSSSGGLLGVFGSSSTADDSTTPTPAVSTRLVSSILPTSTPLSSAVLVPSAISKSAIVPNSPSVVGSILASSTGLASVIGASAVANGTVAIASSGIAILAGSSTSIVPATTAAPASTAQPSSAGPQAVPVTTITTDAAGQQSVITLVLTQTASQSVSAAAASSTAGSSDQGSGISKGAIIGISVAVGVVVMGLIGCAVWRMKRRNGDEDEAIRWPELNRHGDSDAHHALPARQTGQHGFETNPLSRSLSNSSSIFTPSNMAPALTPTPMALNGSSFGAASSLEDYDHNHDDYNEKDSTPPIPSLPPIHNHTQDSIGLGSPPGYHSDGEDDYTSLPPVVQMNRIPTGGGYEGISDEGHGVGAASGAREMSMNGGGRATF